MAFSGYGQVSEPSDSQRMPRLPRLAIPVSHSTGVDLGRIALYGLPLDDLVFSWNAPGGHVPGQFMVLGLKLQMISITVGLR